MWDCRMRTGHGRDWSRYLVVHEEVLGLGRARRDEVDQGRTVEYDPFIKSQLATRN